MQSTYKCTCDLDFDRLREITVNAIDDKRGEGKGGSWLSGDSLAIHKNRYNCFSLRGAYKSHKFNSVERHEESYAVHTYVLFSSQRVIMSIRHVSTRNDSAVSNGTVT